MHCRKMRVLLLAAVCAAAAAARGEEAQGWKFAVAPYAWLMNMDGDITVKGQKATVDADFVDMLDEVDLAGSLFLTARKDAWILWAEGDYFNLSDEAGTPVGKADIDTESSFLSGGLGYSLAPFCPAAQLDLFAGVRYLDMDSELSIRGIPNDANASSCILDPVLGARLTMPLGEAWTLYIPVSISAGGDSDFVSDAQINAAYAFSETISGRIGYRCLYYDFEEDDVDAEIAFNGVTLGVEFEL